MSRLAKLWQERAAKQQAIPSAMKKDESTTRRSVPCMIRLKPGQRSRTGVAYHLVLIVDSSSALPLNYIAELVNNLFRYIKHLLASNPLLQIALIILQNRLAFLEVQFTSNLDAFEEVLQDGLRPSGHCALATGLDIALRLLEGAESCSREIVYVNFSRISVDCLDGDSLVEAFKRLGIVLNIVSVDGSFWALSNLARQTSGKHILIQRPPPGLIEQRSRFTLFETLRRLGRSRVTHRDGSPGFIHVGFPSHSKLQAICFCHGRPCAKYYSCPLCSAILCGIGRCCVCGLQLMLHPNLHQGASLIRKAPAYDASREKYERCGICQFPGTRATAQCATCKAKFCASCSHMLQDSRIVCPLCIIKPHQTTTSVTGNNEAMAKSNVKKELPTK
ncbi:TFIIH P44 [Giardia muris]|uniref:TFIIH P44 n=1 Tax=Giardia muris TaxID=5742 RepID=A0A4Z1SKY4_GIAMU|nr:TFIIH P44 [Giardia muris]|eukprot:TNJ26314.1 TFIIH P44 [Giardia muris]